jgi:thiol-disulfide isomerase/thioredoxin
MMRAMKTTSFLLLVAAALAASSAVAADTAKIASYKLKDAASGKATSLASLKGKYKAIYIDVFASWCGPCQTAIPEVIKLNNRLKKKGAAFVGLDLQDQWVAMQNDIKKTGINYTVLHDDNMMGGIADLLKIEGFPTVIILDGKTLKEQKRWVGYDRSGKELAEQVQTLKALGVKA